MASENKDISRKVMKEFISEAEEIIERLNQNLLRLDRKDKGGPVDPETLNEIFRAAHSLKGLAGMFGISTMTTLAHHLEDILDKLRLGRIALGGSLLDLLFESIELLGRIVGQASAGEGTGEALDIEGMIGRLDASISVRKAEPEENPIDHLRIDPEILAVLTEYEEHRLAENVRERMRIYKIHAKFDLLTFDQSLGDLTAQMKTLGEVITTLPSANATSETEIEFDILLGTRRDEREIRAEMHPGVQAEKVAYRDGPADGAAPEGVSGHEIEEDHSPRPEREGGEEAIGSLKSITETVRVDITKLDYLMNLVGELGLIRSNVAQVGNRMKAEHGLTGYRVELDKIHKQLDRKLAELRDSVMDVRMVPLRQVFDKLSRVVRKISRDSGKRVRFEVEGAETELDKLIMEGLIDPLMHIVRNAIDHGIEPVPERRAAEKPEEGVVRIVATQRGNHVVIEASDDGRGMDPARIREVAIEKGLISPSATLSRREIFDLIFLPGFTTKQVATEVSGRGMGMDVVKGNIAKLSGIIDIDSRPGEGTCFSLVLPITLAIIQALVVEVCGRSYAVPLNSVIECLTLACCEIRSIERQEVLQLRDEVLPLLRLDRAFRIRREGREPEKCFVVVVGLAEYRLGLVVDRIRDRQDIVIKSLGASLQNLKGIAGATELCDQETILVLDIGSLIEQSARRRE